MSTTTAQLFVIVFLTAFLVWREVVNQRAQKELLNRLMSRDLEDYSNVSGEKRPSPKVRNPITARAQKAQEEFAKSYSQRVKS